MAGSGTRVAEILVRARLIDEWQARSALARQGQWGGRLAKHVAEMGFATEEAMAETVAQALGLQRIELGMLPKDAGALSKVDMHLAEERGIFPYALRDSGKTLWLAMADPCDIETADYIASRTGCRVRATVAGEREILVSIYRHYKNQAPPSGLLGENNTRLRTAPPAPNGETLAAAAAVEAAAARRPTVRNATMTTPLPRVGNTPSTNLSTEIPSDVSASLPPAAAEYIKKLQLDLEKTTRVLRALLEVCIDKQLLTSEEVRAAASKLVGR